MRGKFLGCWLLYCINVHCPWATSQLYIMVWFSYQNTEGEWHALIPAPNSQRVNWRRKHGYHVWFFLSIFFPLRFEIFRTIQSLRARKMVQLASKGACSPAKPKHPSLTLGIHIVKGESWLQLVIPQLHICACLCRYANQRRWKHICG